MPVGERKGGELITSTYLAPGPIKRYIREKNQRERNSRPEGWVSAYEDREREEKGMS